MDLKFKTLYANNCIVSGIRGIYAVLVYKDYQNLAKAVKYAIIQQKDLKYGTTVECYNLFEKQYYGIVGNNFFPEPCEDIWEDMPMEDLDTGLLGIYRDTFTHLELNSDGDFIRTFKTEEEAIRYANKRANDVLEYQVMLVEQAKALQIEM